MSRLLFGVLSLLTAGDDGAEVPKSLNRLAAVGFLVGAVAGVAGFFSFPVWVSLGLSNLAAVVVILTAEFGAAVLVVVSALYLYTEQDV